MHLQSHHLTRLTRLLVSLALWAGASLCQAQDTAPGDAAEPAAAQGLQPRPWTFTVGPYVHHWSKNPDHRTAFIFALEKHQDERWLIGLSLFRNSFGQPSAYAYTGYHWHGFLGQPRLTAKVTAGIIYGYTGEYEDKVPLNWNGFSPGLIPSLGYKLSERDALHVMVLGGAGYILAYSHTF
jgi:hypothetical protein